MKNDIGNWRVKLKQEIDSLFSVQANEPEESKISQYMLIENLGGAMKCSSSYLFIVSVPLVVSKICLNLFYRHLGVLAGRECYWVSLLASAWQENATPGNYYFLIKARNIPPGNSK